MKTKRECRVCLKNEGKIPIFGDDVRPDISLEIRLFGGIKLEKTDDFPKGICQDCNKLLENAISFRKAALHADVVLQQRKQINSSSQSPTIKLEDDTDHSEFIVMDTQPEFLAVKTAENKIGIKNEESSERKFHGDDKDDKKLIKFELDKKSKNEKLQCNMCNKSFKSKKAYEDHEISITHKKKCALQEKKLTIKVEKKSAIARDQKCDECNKFFTPNQYQRHLKAGHNRPRRPIKTMECSVCKKVLRTNYLARHKQSVHGIGTIKPELKPKGPVECPICKKMFAPLYIKTHMKIHNETHSKTFICDQCGKEFGFQSSFINHRATHSNVLRFKCDYCPYRGRSKQLLRLHTRTHTGDYPFTKTNLNRHMQRHTGMVDFLCDSCNRGFYSKLELERHIAVAHLGIKKHICNICGVAFGYRKGLMKHLKTHLQVQKGPKGVGKPKATYLKIQEEMLLQTAGLNGQTKS